MKIAILNECFFEKEHIDRLKKLGDVIIYPNTTTEKEVVERLKDADIAISDMFVAPLNRQTLEKTNKLKSTLINISATTFGTVIA